MREQAQPTLEDNISKENAEAGIAYFGTSGGVALRNECTGNKTRGISVDIDDSRAGICDTACCPCGTHQPKYERRSI